MTNFLDDHPQNWANPEYEELRSLLIFIATPGGIPVLRDFADRAGIAFGTFPEGFNDVRGTAKALVKVMGAQGSLRMMIEVAAASQVIREEYRQKLTEMLARSAAIDPQAGANENQWCYDTCWLVGDRVLVNRTTLRAAIANLDDDQTGKHILVVQGEQEKSGKSHSFEMIRYLKERRGGFEVVWIDLARLARGSENERILPEELGQAIATQMGLKKVPERQNQKDERWVQRFCDWMTGELAEDKTVYWIALDHFNKTLLPSGTHFLIQEIALRIEKNLSAHRLILLGFEDIDELPADIIGGLEEDSTDKPIGEKELLAFFTKLYEERRVEQDIDYSPMDVATSVAQVMRKVNFEDKKKYLRSLERAVVREGKRVRTVGGPQ